MRIAHRVAPSNGLGQGDRRSLQDLSGEFDSLMVHMAKTKTSVGSGTVAIIALIACLAVFGALNPEYVPLDIMSRSNDRKVEVSSWTDAVPKNDIVVSYSVGAYSSVAKYRVLKRWTSTHSVKPGTVVRVNATQRGSDQLWVAIKLGAHSACKKRTQVPGTVTCIYEVG